MKWDRVPDQGTLELEVQMFTLLFILWECWVTTYDYFSTVKCNSGYKNGWCISMLFIHKNGSSWLSPFTVETKSRSNKVKHKLSTFSHSLWHPLNSSHVGSCTRCTRTHCRQISSQTCKDDLIWSVIDLISFFHFGLFYCLLIEGSFHQPPSRKWMIELPSPKEVHFLWEWADFSSP